MNKVDLGTGFKMDVARLLDTRMLVMASSGGGKSWAMRKLIESVYGQCQILVLDIEGEFGSLREKFDFILAGKGGDITTDPRYAEALARRLLELNTDAILDLYELKQHERIRFVRLFLDAMVNSPKDLWHPVVVILDEAHIFAPEKGSAESLNAVIDMESRGRKRGFCLIPATQRLAKLHKDVAAECQNKLIGLANMDIDRKRAAEELGFTEKAQVLTLRDMEPGEFYAVGPAFERGVHKVKIGPVATKHPKSGSGTMKVHLPAPTAKVKAVLARLADLPKEAEQEMRDTAALRARVVELERQLKQQPKPAPDPLQEQELMARAQKASTTAAADMDGLWKKKVKEFRATLDQAVKTLDAGGSGQVGFDYKSMTDPKLILSRTPVPVLVNHQPAALPRVKPLDPEAGSVSKCGRAILSVLYLRPGQDFSKAQCAARSGYSLTSSGFANSVSELVTAGFIERYGKFLRLKPEVQVAHLVTEQPKTLQDWMGKLGKCEAAILKRLLEAGGGTVAKEDVAQATSYSLTSSGFANSISHLCTLGLVVRWPDGLAINPDLVGN